MNISSSSLTQLCLVNFLDSSPPTPSEDLSRRKALRFHQVFSAQGFTYRQKYSNKDPILTGDLRFTLWYCGLLAHLSEYNFQYTSGYRLLFAAACDSSYPSLHEGTLN